MKSTDDAFIDARTVSISAQVGAAIVDVPVTDNQLVEPGAVLVRLDDRDYRAAGRSGCGAGRSGQGQHRQYRRSGRRPAGPHRSGRETNRAGAGGAYLRAAAGTALHGAASKTAPAPSSRRSNMRPVSCRPRPTTPRRRPTPSPRKSSFRFCKAQRDVAEAQLEQARAAQEQADANLSRTLITAPVAGRVSRLTAAKGNYAAVGQALMMFVPRDVWVTANFKETQLLTVRPGDPVDIRIDTYPRPQIQGPRRQHPGRQRHRVQPAAGRERHRQFRQDRPARSGQDRVRRAARRAARARHVGGADGPDADERAARLYGAAEPLGGGRSQSLADRHRHLNCHLHGRSRHRHRQRFAALHRRQPRGQRRRKHLDRHDLSDRQCGHSADQRLAVERDRPQALLHDLRRGIYSRIAVVRACYQPHCADRVSHPAGSRRRRHADERAGDACRHVLGTHSVRRLSPSTALRSSWRRPSVPPSAAGSRTIIRGIGSSSSTCRSVSSRWCWCSGWSWSRTYSSASVQNALPAGSRSIGSDSR